MRLASASSGPRTHRGGRSLSTALHAMTLMEDGSQPRDARGGTEDRFQIYNCVEYIIFAELVFAFSWVRPSGGPEASSAHARHGLTSEPQSLRGCRSGCAVERAGAARGRDHWERHVPSRDRLRPVSSPPRARPRPAPSTASGRYTAVRPVPSTRCAPARPRRVAAVMSCGLIFVLSGAGRVSLRAAAARARSTGLRVFATCVSTSLVALLR